MLPMLTMTKAINTTACGWWQVTNCTGFSNATDEPHLEAIVIDGLSMKVYQDGELKGSATLPCLVTDCTGDTLELGREGDRIA